jgi:hypothetical protein
MERPSPDDEPEFQPAPVPGGEAERKPRDPKSKNPQVTPLDEDKNVEDGIEIKET